MVLPRGKKRVVRGSRFHVIVSGSTTAAAAVVVVVRIVAGVADRMKVAPTETATAKTAIGRKQRGREG